MKTFHYILIVIITLLHGYKLSSQSKSENMIWLQVSEKVQFTPTFSGLILVQKRYFLDKPDTYQDLFWASGGYRLKHVQVGGGLMYFSAHKLLKSTYKSIPEVRPFQYLTFTRNMPASQWNYQVRAIVEERFLSRVTGDEFVTGENFQLRFRLRCNAGLDLIKNMTLNLSNEFLWIDDMQLTQNRASAELAYQLRGLHLSSGYMNWFVRSIDTPYRQVWLLRINHRL